ncbi:insulinase family protein [Gilvimarinus xylanilyticus]|uniref:Insulinase family protein n=1 Tax=Gilvimarinus xylanilyticus TaxID=2944139 RepID=A0A9X2HUR8_9GAMM|nr:insulinase family protein [Gilvimarinus xylanilyticus]MCP8898585.1 insulinase family protein [Gilvimarinus xylanilyticus]
MTELQHPAFECERRVHLDALNLTVELYRHLKTGAQHIHLASSNPENVFLVALRTVPQDSTGVAHILEHTALCGSAKYPVRDPFFMMTRRSLNTFMNAFTSSDWTAYPFASQNRKDFDNLLDVYLDAVFFASLDPLDFAQEGHRLEFAQSDDPSSALVYKGVVYNEMKGAMSSVPAQLWQKLSSHLFPTATYHHNSGGDPEHIPDLTYDQLQGFYRRHYHPSNAIFMTYGDIPAAEHQAKFEQQALNQFEAQDIHIGVKPEKRLHSPIRVEDAYPLESGEESSQNKTHVVIGWLLGQATDLEAALEAHLVASILLDNSASPLLKALEQTKLGQAPSPLCGLDDSQFEMSFACGLEGCDSEATQAVEALVLETLQEVADQGVDPQVIESSLHQLELSQREVGGDGFPYGLQLIMTALTAATHRGDPVAQLDLDSALVSLREKTADPEFIQQRVRELLLENNHRVTLTLRPDTQMGQRTARAQEEKLAAIKAELSESERQAIIQQATALLARQEQEDDDSLLPQVTRADIQPQMSYTAGSHENLGAYPLRAYGAGTNGLVYQQLVVRLPELSERQQHLLGIYCLCLTEVGHGQLDYLQAQLRQAEQVGSISARVSIRSNGTDPQHTDAYLTLSAKALARNADACAQLMHDTFEQVRFDEHERIAELIAQARARREQSITGNGHALAMQAASAGVSPSAKIAHELGGLEATARLIAIDNGNREPTQLAEFCRELKQLHTLMQRAPRQLLLVGEQEQLDDYRELLGNIWQDSQEHTTDALSLPPVQRQIHQGWLTNTQVNFCAKAYPTVASDHKDAPALTVLAGILRNGFLHRSIREQGGAYGGGASQDNNAGAFRFFSYRDPRLSETLDDFDRSVQWVLDTDIDSNEIEQAILGIISSIDKPASPAGEAKQTFHAELFGRTREKRESFRARVLEVTQADIKAVARHYLQPDAASVAVVAPHGAKQTLQSLGLEIKTL